MAGGTSRAAASGFRVAGSGFVLTLAVFLFLSLAAASQAAVDPIEQREMPGVGPSSNGGPGGRLFGHASVSSGRLLPGEARYIVVLKDSIKHPGAVAEDQAEEVDGDVSLVYRHALKGYAATLPKDEVESLEEDSRVDYITPDRLVEVASQATPTGISRINAPKNPNVDIDEEDDLRVDADVAVIDTGIDYEHPDLDVAGRTSCIPAEEKNVEECVDGTGEDDHSHGTHVAGTIGALDNGEGVVGVAPGARLWAVKVMNKEGEGLNSWIIAGIDWVTAHAETIEVANMSLGGEGESKAIEEAIAASVDAGVVYVVAAGNESQDAKDFYPANGPDVITVSAIADYNGKAGGAAEYTCHWGGRDDYRASFSNYGEDVEVAAPGVCIRSTVPGGKYAEYSGTSMASPHVAGAAAILAGKANPEDREDVEEIRAQIVDDGNFDWTDNSKDGVKEPLLDLGEEVVLTEDFDLKTGGELEATLHGRVNPRGAETTYRFEYDTTPYEEGKEGHGTSVPVPDAAAGSGSKYVSVSETIGGLSAQTVYHYRLVASNSKGTFYGADRELATTPPTAQTGEATDAHVNDAILHGLVDPEGAETIFYFEAGASTSYGRVVAASTDSGSEPSASGNEEVSVSAAFGGLAPNRTYHYRLIAENLAGTTYGEDETFTTTGPSEWLAQPTPGPVQQIPSPWGKKHHSLSKISCVSKSSCMALGNEYWGGFAERWDGKEWSSEAMPEVAGADATWPEGISCSSSDWCVAAGDSFSWEAPNFDALVEHWNGDEWILESLSLPAEAIQSYLYDVSCVSASSCVAVGWYEKPASPGSKEILTYLLVESWDGVKWSRKSLSPSGLVDGYLNSVSCVDADYCVATGFYAVWKGANGLEFWPVAERWNGEKWSVIDEGLHDLEVEVNPRYPALYDVSCAARDACTVISNLGAGETLKPLRWDGESWTAESLPEPVGTERGWPVDISCPDVDTCTMVGESELENFLWVPVAYRWSGGKWSIQSTAEPTGEEGGKFLVGSGLTGVSCVSPSTCLSSGYFIEQSAGETRGMVEVYQAPGPDVSTDPATQVKPTGATLHAVVNAQGNATSYQFEYGETKAYGSEFPVSAEEIGSGGEDVEVSKSLVGLEPATTYHYRVTATSAEGTTSGEDRVFTTWSATQPHFSSSYGETGAGNGQLSEPAGIAIGAEGDIWVADTGNDRIQQFDSEGKYVSQLGETGAGNGQLSEPAGIGIGGATINAEDSIWVTDAGNNRIQAFDPASGKYLANFGESGAGEGQFSLPKGIVFDPAGNLWIADSQNDRIQKWVYTLTNVTTEAATQVKGTSATLRASINPEGSATSYYFEYGKTTSYGSEAPLPSEPIGSGTSSVKVGRSIGGLSLGTTYHYRVVAENSAGIAYGVDKAFTTKNVPKVTTEAASEVKATSAIINATVNPEGTDTSYYFEYTETGAIWIKLPFYGESIGSGTKDIKVSQNLGGLAPNATYKYRVLATSEIGTSKGEDKTLTTLKLQKATTGAATAVKATSATINATVNPGGILTSYYFEYGKTNSYGTKVPASPKSAGSGISNIAVSEEIGGLEAGGTTYHYRVVTTSENGIVNGVDQTLTTQASPEASTRSATEVRASRATLNAVVHPKGAATDYYFEYGQTTSYGTKVPVSPKSIGSGTSGVKVSESLKGLSDEITYHFRVVASNEGGTTSGADRTFTTSAAVPVLCAVEEEGSTCEEGNQYSEEEWFEAYANEPMEITFLSGSTPMTLACEGSYLSGWVKTQEGSNRSSITIEEWSLGSDCIRDSKVTCDELEQKNLPYAGSLTWTSGADGRLAIGNGGSGEPGWYFNLKSCSDFGLPTGCTYSLEPDLAFEGGSPAQLALPETSLGTSSSTCGKNATLKPATYIVSSPDPVYMARLTGVSPPMATTEAAGAVKATSATLNGAVNPEGSATSYYFEYGKTTSYGTKVPASPKSVGSGTSDVAVSEGIEGLEASTTYHYRLVAESEAGMTNGEDLTLTTSKSEAPLPKATTEATTAIKVTSATLNGAVNPEGSATSYYFECGKTTSYGTKVPASPKSAGSGTSNVVVSESYASLEAGTTYHCRLVAESEAGTSYGEDKTFTTLKSPKATTEAATNVKFSTATLNGTVNPEGSETSYYFEYGESTSYGSKTSSKSAGSGTSNVAASEPLSGLKAGMTYHFRIVATGASTVEGADKTFTTATDSRFSFDFGKEGTGNGEFKSPYGIAYDSSGNIWVADAGNNRIEKFNSKGEYVSQFGKEGTSNGEFKSPKGIAIDSTGNIWVVDTGNNRVQKFNSKGEYVSQFGKEGTGEGEFKSPIGIALDSADRIFVVDSGNNRVQKFDSKAKYLNQFGKEGTGNGEFKSPTGIAIDSSNFIFVVDSGNNRVQKFNSSFTYQIQFGSKEGKAASGDGEFNAPTGIAVDIAGRLWVTDSGNNRAQRFSSTGTYIEQFGEKGSGAGQLQSPLGITSPSAWELLFVDSANNRVQKWTMVPDAPVATTEAATEVKSTSAILNATVNPNSLTTEYHFEYGKTTSYGTSIPIPDEAIGSGQSGVKASKAITGLTSGQKYNFRVVATNSSGTTYGVNKQFTTP
ncbi:MAG TPA: S8 family serine peptidase [Solirubrobacterales bacterium]